MFKSKSTNRFLSAATLSLALVLVTSCSPSAKLAADHYQKGQAAEASKELQEAEKHYINAISAARDCKSAYYQLAAVNRLTDLERQLNSPSKSKSYMNQAATLAESSSDASNKSQSENLLLAKERQIAIMRLANWLFEDGNFVSARKLYAEAVTIEAQLKIDTQMETSAAARLKALNSLEHFEDNQVVDRISTNRYSTDLRGPQAAQRARDRRKAIESLQAKLGQFKIQSTPAVAKEVLDLLSITHNNYGSRENEYRTWLKYTTDLFIGHGQQDILAPLIEEDMKEFTNFSRPQLDAAIPEAVENATFLTQDLIIMARIQLYQNRFIEMLDSCLKAQKFADKVVTKDSEDDYNLAFLTAVAYESNQRNEDALPYRKRALDLFPKFGKDMHAYSDYLGAYAIDLTAAHNYSEAKATFEKTFAIKDKIKDRSNFGHLLQNYSKLLKTQSDYKKARQVALRALHYAIRDPEHSSLINCYILLASICKEIDPQQAVEYTKLALEAMQKYDCSSPGFLVAQTIIDLAELQLRTGKTSDALKTLDNGIKTEINQGRELSAFTAGMYNLKASVLRDLKNFQQEEETRMQAVDLCRRFAPPQPGPLASTLFQTGMCFQEHGNFEQAEKLYCEAIDVTKNEKDKVSNQMGLLAKAGLANAFVSSGKNLAQAERLKTELISSYRSALGESTRGDISLCIAVSNLCIALKDKKNAQQSIDEATVIYSKDKLNGKVMFAGLEKQKQKLTSLTK